MAKPSKDKQRRAVVEQMRRDQQRAEKRRTYAIITACAVVGLIIIGLGAYPLLKEQREQGRFDDIDLASIGASADTAGCQDVTTAPASGSGAHRPEGQPLFYEDGPPSSGPHYPVTAPMVRKFYTADDRPKLGYLVHNLEHGYNILWFDETISEDEEQLAAVEAIANKFPGSEPRNKFIAAPWTADDGAPFPDGAHVAMTHWSVGDTPGDAEGQLSIRQFCEAPSGEAVATFVEDYPNTDSPEPNAI